MTSKEVLESVLQLPEAERLLIVGKILETLPDEISTAELSEDEFLAELDRCSDDWEGAVSWAELKSSLQSGT